MRSAFICLTLAIVFSTVFSQRPIVRYSENLKKAVPHHYNHDQKNTDRSLDKIARGHKIEPPLPPLRAHSEVPWLRWVQEGRWAAQADKNSELHKVRARLLEEKLKPNNFAFRPQINPQLKPKLKRKENVRHKREAMMPQVPEVIMQPDNEVKLSQPHEQMQRKTEGLEKRDKRQILYFINKPPKLLARSPRTTPNPFIRDTHIEDYDIIRPEVGEREGMIPTIEAGSSDLGSYPLVSETSDLEYESDYTISMSDSEEWHNYPLTTPSGPNPGWQLSTLADIYQKQRRSQNQILRTEQTRYGINKILQVWQQNRDQTLTRIKRSPKERKRKIGAYKEKIKQRRKLKDIRRKRRIIRNSKEDKAVKEDLKDEKTIDRLLEKPRSFPRQTAYQVEETSREILWSNGTHNVVEDKGASVKWINETHYVIYKDKDNLTDEWYNQHHVLCYNEEWENKTSEEKKNAIIGAEEEDEDSVAKDTEKKKSGGKAKVKTKTGKKKGGKREADKKAPKPKKKVKKAKKIQTVKNVNEEPKDPRRDMRGKNLIEKNIGSEEKSVENKKKDRKKKIDDERDTSKIKKKKTDDQGDTSKIKKRKNKTDKNEIEKDESDSSKKKKTRNKETNDEDRKDSPSIKKKKRKKEKDSQKEKGSDKKTKTEKEKKKRNKTDESKEIDKKKKKEKKTNAENMEKDKKKTRKKRSIYHSDETETAEVKWEKVQKSEYDGWTVFGGQDDKSQVYDASYELIETKNITKKHH